MHSLKAQEETRWISFFVRSITIPPERWQLPSRLIYVAPASSTSEKRRARWQICDATIMWQINEIRLHGPNDARYSSWTAPHQQLRNISLFSIRPPSDWWTHSPEQYVLTESPYGEALSCRIIHPYDRTSTEALSKQLTCWSMSWQTCSMYLWSRSCCICAGGKRKICTLAYAYACH